MSVDHNMPLVSIIIPTYNHAHFLKKCLSSVVDQTFSNWEAVVIDNHSKDNTCDVVASFNDKRIRLIQFSNSGVIAASRNKGVESAKGDYIAFLDSDDFWYNDKLKVSFEYLNNADIVFHTLDVYTKTGKSYFRKARARRLKMPVFVDLMTNGNPLGNSSVVVRKKLIDDVGGFDENESLVAMEDCDMWLRIAKITEKFVGIPNALGGYWMGEGNVTNILEKRAVGIKTLYDKHIRSLTATDMEQAEFYKSYHIGRTKQKMGLSSEAVDLFKFAKGSRNMEIKFKSILLEKWLMWQR